jgi:hypothetical protein
MLPLSQRFRWLLLLLAAGAVQTGIAETSLAPAPETCSVFAHPEHFVDHSVTIEAKVSDDTESRTIHPTLALRPPDQCGIAGRFWFTLPDKQERELANCQLTKIVGIGKLTQTVAVDSDRIGAPVYSIRIEHLLETTQSCGQFTREIYFLPFPLISPSRSNYLVGLPDVLPPSTKGNEH